MVVVHHSATAIIEYAKIARKQHLHSVCLDSLSKIHSIPSVPVLDCFQKIRQQVRTHETEWSTLALNETTRFMVSCQQSTSTMYVVDLPNPLVDVD